MKVELERATFDVNNGAQRKDIRLTGGKFLRSIAVVVAAAVAWDGAHTIVEDALAKNLTFRVYLDGSGPRMEFTGDMWKLRNSIMNEVDDDYTEISGTTGAQTGSWRFIMDIADPRLVLPRFTMYDLQRGSTPRIEVSWGGLSTLTTTAIAGTDALSSLTIDTTMECDERPAGMPPKTFVDRRWKQYARGLIAQFPAGGTDRAFELDTGQISRRLFIRTGVTATTGARTNDLISSLEWSLNGNKLGRQTWAMYRAEARSLRTVVPPTGTIIIEFDPSNSLKSENLLNLSGVSQGAAKLLFNMAAALANGFQVDILEEQVIFPRA